MGSVFHSRLHLLDCLDLIGWEHAAALLPTVLGQMVAAGGAEESTSWRQPVDLLELSHEAAGQLRGLFPAGRNKRGWSGHTTLAWELLGDDRAKIIGALKAAILGGAAPSDLGRSLAYGAALRWRALEVRTGPLIESSPAQSKK